MRPSRAAAPAASAPAAAPAASAPAAAARTALVAVSGDDVQNSDWDFISKAPPAASAPVPGPSSLALALVHATNGTAGTEMLEFMDQDTSDSPPKEQCAKCRAVLLAGEKQVWGVDHVATETLTALDEVNSEAIVAVHPITQEHLTHTQVMDLVTSQAYNNKMSPAQAVEELNKMGATNHQSAMNILFPTESV